ncbi:MAG: hypothetical protein BWY76_00118 [bacterium ADurb.Bin429]|nr:MAG: hypothetical protein BWY76_00118 [bacterium ADurb.Bin429]
MSLPAELRAAARALPDGAALVAMLPVATKHAPGTADSMRITSLRTGTTRAVVLANPDASVRPSVSTLSYVARAHGDLAVPATPATRAQGHLPEMTLIALAPTATDKLNPRATMDAGDLRVLQVTMMAPARLRDLGTGARPQVAVEAAPGVRVLPAAIAVEKVGERGVLTDLPVAMALLPDDGKQTPAMTALTDIATARGVRAREPRLRDVGLLARVSGDPAQPTLTPLAIAVLDVPAATMRTAPAAAVEAPRYTRVTGKPAPVSSADADALAMTAHTQRPVVLTPGEIAARAAAAASPATYAADPGALNSAPAHDRRVDQETAPVKLAAQPGKLAPDAAAKSTAGMWLTPAYPVAPVSPKTGGTAPAPVVAGAPRIEQPAADVMIDLEQHHTVKSGQTLLEIARVYATTPEELLKRNPGISPERPLPEGVALVVPGQTARIYVDDTPIADAPNPFIAQGHSMVPIRHIVEAKGGVVVWLPATREVNAWADNTFMGLKVGDNGARINGDSYILPVAPTIRQARAMVPLRYLMTALRLQVTYNPKTGTYLLMSQNEK